MSQVTFAETHGVRNHPLHMKSSAGGRLEKIDERKSQSPSRKGHSSTGRSQSKKGGAQDSTHKGTDISNLTINSNRLEDSVKAPGRAPARVENLT